MHRWIDNFDTVTTAVIAADSNPLPSEFLSPADVARLEAVFLNPDDFCELALLGPDGTVESLLCFQSTGIARDINVTGAAPEWPVGSRIIAPVTAMAISRCHSAAHAILSSSEDALTLWYRSEAWEWYPPGLVTPTISCAFYYAGSEYQALNTIVEITSPNAALPFELVLDGTVPDGVKLPAGATGSYDPELESYQLTLPASNNYRLTFKGIAVRTLEISDFSEYTLSV